MFAGKTEELLRRVRRAAIAGRRVAVFGHALDVRQGPIGWPRTSGSGLPVGRRCQPPRTSRPRSRTTPTSSRSTKRSSSGPGSCRSSAGSPTAGLVVIVAGLDVTFDGRPFEPLPSLMALAEQVDKLTAICSVCGEEAVFHVRLSATARARTTWSKRTSAARRPTRLAAVVISATVKRIREPRPERRRRRNVRAPGSIAAVLLLVAAACGGPAPTPSGQPSAAEDRRSPPPPSRPSSSSGRRSGPTTTLTSNASSSSTGRRSRARRNRPRIWGAGMGAHGELLDAAGPEARAFAAVGRDPDRGVVVVHGGISSTGDRVRRDARVGRHRLDGASQDGRGTRTTRTAPGLPGTPRPSGCCSSAAPRTSSSWAIPGRGTAAFGRGSPKPARGRGSRVS